MMNNFDISDLETTIAGAIRDAGVASVVYPNRPKSADPKVDAFVVCCVDDAVEDMAAYGVCHLEVSLFARDVANVKNNVKLGLMYKALVENLPAEVGRYMIDRHPNIIADAPDNYGFHARVIEIQVIIKQS